MSLPDAAVVRAPMKLVIAGEYAVLEPGTPGIVAAIDRHVTCTARAVAAGLGVSIAAPTLGQDVVQRAPEGAAPLAGALSFDPVSEEVERKLRVARIATELAFEYVIALGLAPRALSIVCESDGGHIVLVGSGERAKLGLGSSAAACVATIGAILAAHGISIDRKTFRASLFKLALIAHGRSQGGRGSGIDVAAAMHGGILEYVKHDPETFPRRERSILDLIRAPWPGLTVEALPAPPNMRLLAGFTGASASTTDMIARIESWRKERPTEYDRFVRRSQGIVRALSNGLRRCDTAAITECLQRARSTLVSLGEQAGAPIETPMLERLAKVAADQGCAGKLSGAGGGDCGIALAFDEETAQRILSGWRAVGITPIPIEIAQGGMQEMCE